MGQLSNESYADTLNRLFPWGCETESEVIAELARRVEELAAVCEFTELPTRSALADIELAHRIERLAERVEQLERLLEKGHKKED